MQFQSPELSGKFSAGTTTQRDMSENGQIMKANNVCTVAEYMFARNTPTSLEC